MIDIKPDEISAILKQQLSGVQTENQLEEIKYRNNSAEIRTFSAIFWLFLYTFHAAKNNKTQTMLSGIISSGKSLERV